MNTSFLFEMYQRFAESKTRAEQNRPIGTRGIAVNEDSWAIEWQKWDRLKASAEKALEERLK